MANEDDKETLKKEEFQELLQAMKEINAEVSQFKQTFSETSTQAEAINSSFADIANNINISNSLSEEELTNLDKQLNVLREQVVFAEKYNILSREELTQLKNVISGTEEQIGLQKEHAQAVKGTVDKLIGAKKETMGIKMHMEAINYIQNKMSKEEALSRVMNKAADAVGAYFKAVIDATFAFDKSASKVAKTLSNTQYKGMMEEMRNDALYAGASVEELGQNVISLGQNFTDFTRLNTATQKELSMTATRLNAAGFSADAFAKTLDVGVKTLGMSEKQVTNFSMELVNFGKAAGIPMAKLSSDLARVGPQLSKFGSNAERTFKQLSLQAKATGIELDRMFGITEQYTTFDGAAKAAGNLNAILGGNFVNSLDLMNASLEDPAETIQLLKDSMDASGKSFDDMPNAMKRVVAEAAGFQDVGEAARVFGMDSLEAAEAMEEQAITQEKLAEASRSFLDIQTKMQLMMAQLVPVIMPVIDALGLLVDGIAKFANTGFGQATFDVLGFISVLTGFAFIVGMVVVKVKAGLALIKTAFAGPKKAAQELNEEMEKSNKGSAKKFGETIKQIGEAARGTWREMLAFGAAILMIGGGIAIAAFGLAELVKAFQGLTGEQVLGALGALIIVMGGFAIMVNILAGASLAAAAPMLALGGAIALIGLGIGIAAAGMSLLVSSFKDLSGPQLVTAGLALAGIAIGVGLLVASLSALGNPLAAAGAAVLLSVGGAIALIGAGIGLAAAGVSLLMKEIPTAASGLKSFSENLESFVDPSGAIQGLTSVAEAIQRVAEALDEVSMTKLLLLKTFGGIPGTASPIARTATGTSAGFGTTSTTGVTTTASATPTINIELTIPVKVEGSEFKNVMAKVVQEEIQKNATNASSVNLRIK